MLDNIVLINVIVVVVVIVFIIAIAQQQWQRQQNLRNMYAFKLLEPLRMYINAIFQIASIHQNRSGQCLCSDVPMYQYRADGAGRDPVCR